MAHQHQVEGHGHVEFLSEECLVALGGSAAACLPQTTMIVHAGVAPSLSEGFTLNKKR
jgi:hypothetical protein